MTVQELIDIAKEYNPESEVRVAMGPWISSIDKIKPCVDMDTNKVNMTIYVEDKKMNLLEKNPETDKIKRYHSFVGEIMFSDIFEQVNNAKDLKFIILNLCASMETAANDWYSDNVEPYVDPFCINYDYMEE